MTDLVANIRTRFVPLLAEAEGALSRREQQYPTLVTAGRMDEQQALAEIRTWRAIVADWRHALRGVGARDTEVPVADKIAVLTSTIGRYNAALAREISAAPARVQRDCVEGANLALLDDIHGEAVASILSLHRCRERIEDLRIFYRQELPGHAGLFRGIHDYLDFHRQVRTRAVQRKAA